MIEAIQTSYKGTTYRSKIEARWATFFDCLGVTYEYEPESFELGLLNPNWDWEDSQELREELEEDGCTDSEIRREIWLEKNKKLMYIPDFWLPEFQHWVEIKGKEPTVEEVRKARKLAYQTGWPVNILYGSIPGAKEEDWGKRTEVYQSDMNIIALLVIKYGVKAMERAYASARYARFEVTV
jgi:hypothetical protein